MTSKRILLIDDDKGSCQIFHKLFSSWHMEVSHAQTLSKAFTRLKLHNYDATVLNSDAVTNCQSELHQVIEKLSSDTNVIVAVSGHATDDDVRALRLLGVGLINKPITPDALFQTLMSALNKRAADYDREKFLAEIQRTFNTIQQQSAALDRMAKLMGSFLDQLPTSLLHGDEKDTNIGNILAHPDFFRVRSLLSSFLDELRKDEGMKMYESQLDLLETCLDDIEYGSTPKCIGLKNLSFRELRVVSMIGCGMTTDQIAEQLHISPDTVKTHRRNIRKKLHIVGDKYDLASFLRGNNQIDKNDKTILPTPKRGVLT